MAVRRPLYWNGTEIQEMNDTQIDAMVDRMIYLYGEAPSVKLSRVGASGNLNSIGPDTRYQAGGVSQSATGFVSEALTQDISIVTGLTYDNIQQNINASVAYPGISGADSYPLYWDSVEGVMRTMTATDMIDTFVDPATDILSAGNTQANVEKKAGVFFIDITNQTSPNTEIISTDPIFEDTRADASAYTSGGIPETQDQPITAQSYYIRKYNSPVWNEPTHEFPLQYRIGPNDVRAYSQAAIDTILKGFIQQAAAHEVGQRIRYEVQPSANTTGNASGQIILNTTLDGSSATGYTTRFVNANDYRSQEFPNGIPTTVESWALRITKS